MQGNSNLKGLLILQTKMRCNAMREMPDMGFHKEQESPLKKKTKRLRLPDPNVPVPADNGRQFLAEKERSGGWLG